MSTGGVRVPKLSAWIAFFLCPSRAECFSNCLYFHGGCYCAIRAVGGGGGGFAVCRGPAAGGCIPISGRLFFCVRARGHFWHLLDGGGRFRGLLGLRLFGGGA